MKKKTDRKLYTYEEAKKAGGAFYDAAFGKNNPNILAYFLTYGGKTIGLYIDFGFSCLEIQKLSDGWLDSKFYRYNGRLGVITNQMMKSAKAVEKLRDDVQKKLASLKK